MTVANVNRLATGDGYRPAAGGRAWHPQLQPYVPPAAAVRGCRSRLRPVADAHVAACRRRSDAARQCGAAQSRRITHTRGGDRGVHPCGSRVPDPPPGKPAPAPYRDRQAGRCPAGRANADRRTTRLEDPKRQHSSICPNPDADTRTSTRGTSRADVPPPCRIRSRSSWPCPGRRRCSSAARIVEQQRAAERRREADPVDHTTAASRKTRGVRNGPGHRRCHTGYSTGERLAMHVTACPRSLVDGDDCARNRCAERESLGRVWLRIAPPRNPCVRPSAAAPPEPKASSCKLFGCAAAPPIAAFKHAAERHQSPDQTLATTGKVPQPAPPERLAD
jgi:hypothetical protein